MRREEENMNHDETLSFPNQRMREKIPFQSERERREKESERENEGDNQVERRKKK